MMTIEGNVSALAVFMIINSITPGPNNLMLLQGGLKRGYWGCRWHMLGISFGVVIMLWLSYWGMASFVVEHPTLMQIIKIVGTGYLLWLAYHMAKSDFAQIVTLAFESKSLNVGNKQRFGELPLSFWEAVLFQWLNPKAWTMTVVAPTLAILTSNLFAAQLGQFKFGLNNWPLLIMCMAINLICISFWSAGGQQLRRLVTKPLTMRYVHAFIVLMVVYCAVTLWF
ncbi:LysE family translocator [Psychrobacter sp.]|uniref:LysE family translocator n=1 Tax=Psychrobacter sp. TaxID=56811 RepID=UPI0025EA833C|nr:LysE family translocator [Psychrobacter sp.]